MEQLEASAAEERAPSPDDIRLWDLVVAAVAPLIPEGEVFEDERSRTFDDGEGLQLTMYPGEISISTPYWFGGEQAAEVVDRLRAVAAAIEDATGLAAYDPQADAAFLETGADEAVGTFDRVHDYMAEQLGVQRTDPPRRNRWAFWRR